VEARKASTAIWAGILIPGLGHLYARRSKAAALAFVSVTAVFFLGFALAGVRVFAFTAPMGSSDSLLGQIFRSLPLHLIPECGNLGEATILWLMQPEHTLEHSRLLRLPLATEHLGLALTALAGVLNCFFAADAGWSVASDSYFADRQGVRERTSSWRTRPALIAFLAWLLPGLGHALCGRKRLAGILAASIGLLFVLGLYFSAFCGIDRSQLYWWWGAEFGLGLPTFLGNVLLGPLQITQDVETIDLGITLLSIAGLLNLVVATDAYTIAERCALGLDDREPSAGSASPNAADSKIQEETPV